MTYYDTTQKILKFRYFTDGTKVASNYTTYTNGSVPTGSSNSNNATGCQTSVEGTVNNQTIDNKLYTQGYIAIAGANENSQYSSVGVIGDTVVVAWYDATLGALKMKYNTSPATSFSGYQAFNELPAAGKVTFKIAVDGGTAKDVTVNYSNPSGGDAKHEFAYQLNLVLSNGYGAYAEVDPYTNARVKVRSMQTGANSSISITNLNSGSVYTENTNNDKARYGTGTGSAWVENTIDSDSAGQFVSMKTDSKGGIHFAYYDTGNGDLKYAYMSSVTATPVVVTVDGYQQVGQYVDLALKETTADSVTSVTPYISYYSMSNADT